jgi:hypothetical protein
MSQDSEEVAEMLDLVDLEDQSKIAEKLDLIPFGPCSITLEAWRSLKLSVKAYSSHPEPREVPFCLLGKVNSNRLMITQVVQLDNQVTFPGRCAYSIETARKIEKEASHNRLMLVGFLRTHAGDTVQPLFQDRTAWLSLMFEFNRPMLYFILSSSLKLGAYSVPIETFLQLKEAIRFIPSEVIE